MEEFKKPEHLVIDAIPYLTEILGKGIIKDLQDDEEICPVCHGTGLAISDNVYGLKGDPNKSEHFPYKHQSVSSCMNCYNGVIKKCQYCGKLLNKRTYQCECDASQKAKEQERIKIANEAEQKRLSKATVIEADDPIAKNFVMLYSDDFSSNEGYFSDWDEFFDDWKENHEYLGDKRPEYVWSTSERGLCFDVDSLLEDACDDLWEEARMQISDKDESELQDFLNKWAEKQTGTTTYDVDYQYAIKIPWEEY